ncbi:pyruvate dehydrogenase kinase, partial [Thalassiosira pseudonana CCMP1335]
LRNAQFLHRELPIRIAQRAIDLLTLPHGLNRTREVQSIANTYLQYLQQLRDFPVPTNQESEKEFTNALKSIILDRHSIPMAIARGLQSLKDERKAPVDARRLAEMEEALNRFFTARVGLRFLTEHHVLSGNDENSDALGGIGANCDPVKEVKRTVARVTRLCRESYGIAPEIEVVDCTPDKDAGLNFTYVPHHLRYMLAELLKNSYHSKHHNDPDGGIHDAPTLPPIKIVVTKGAEDVTIKIADRGGGMPRSLTQRIWTFAHSTLSKEGRSREDKGFGLPLARIYARYFGGEVTIKSMEGYGVDAYLYLPVLGMACENLP